MYTILIAKQQPDAVIHIHQCQTAFFLFLLLDYQGILTQTAIQPCQCFFIGRCTVS